MTKMRVALLGAVAAPIVAACFATTSHAQGTPTDHAYCHALVSALREWGGGFLPVGNATAVAIAQCDEGDPGPAIPVLEQQLRDRDITLPPRT